MKTTSLIQITCALVVSLVLSAESKALPSITGNIQFTGAAVTNTSSLGTATELTSITNGLVVGTPADNGSYAPVPGVENATFTAVTFSAIDSFTSIVPPLSSTALWSFSYNGVTYTFNATSISVMTQKSTELEIGGYGESNITGYAQTLGTWSLDLTQSNGDAEAAFGFSASTDALPDSGTTALLILVGIGAVGLGVSAQRRRLAVKA